MKRFLALTLIVTLVLLSACQRTSSDPVLSSVADVSSAVDPSASVSSEEESVSESSSAPEESAPVSSTQKNATVSSAPAEVSPSSLQDSVSNTPSTANVLENRQITPDIQYTSMDSKKPSDAFLASLLDFSCSTSAQILSNETGSTIFCPMSLYYPLALLSTGAGGNTRAQLVSALGLEDMSNQEIAQQCARLYAQTWCDEEDHSFLIANSLWCREDLQISPEFARTAAERFYASMYSVDFADPLTSQQMKQWVSHNTKGLIEPDIKPEPNIALFLCNTIYLKGPWIDQFHAVQTKEFTTESGQKLQHEFMSSTRSGGYYAGENYTRGDIYVKDIGTMSFFLPHEGVALKDLLTADQLEAMLLSDAEHCEIAFSIPKVDIKSKVDLKKSMMALGVQDAFDSSSANFSLFTNQTTPVFIGKAAQEARLLWDENGVEAAAFTGIQVVDAGTIFPPPEPKELTLDRPFLFVLHSDEGILFIGTCYQPS